MKRTGAVVLAVMMAGSTGALLLACGDEETTATPSDGDAAAGKDGGGGTTGDDGGGTTDEDSGGGGEEETDAGDRCIGKYEAPNVNGPGPCGTIDFGEPAANFGAVNADAGTEYVGKNLADGIYDAVNAERASGSTSGSWRETFVVKGNRFTRIRQVDTGSGNGPAPVSYRSGTFQYDGAEQLIKLTYDCAQTGDAGLTPGEDNLPSDAIVADDCSARYRYGAASVRITLRRR